MNIDKSDYYPQSPLDDELDFSEDFNSKKNLETIDIVEIEQIGNSEEIGNGEMTEIPERQEELGEPDDSFITKLANLLSWVLVPVLMPVYGIMLSFGLTILAYTNFGTRLAFTAITFAFNVVIPAIIIIILKRVGMIKDVGLNNREERFIPYIVSIVCLVGTGLFMGHKGAPIWLEMFFMGGAAAGLIELVVNRWWKISVHSAGIAGIVALLVHLMRYEYTTPAVMTWLFIVLGLTGLLGSARIWLGRHTLWQVLAGYAVGFCSVFFIMYIW